MNQKSDLIDWKYRKLVSDRTYPNQTGRVEVQVEVVVEVEVRPQPVPYARNKSLTIFNYYQLERHVR